MTTDPFNLARFVEAQEHRYAGVLQELRAYLAHPVLGMRLRQCAETVNCLEGRSAYQIFGYPDHLKFCSSMTLFELAAEAGSPFSQALDKYSAGQCDQATLALLRQGG